MKKILTYISILSAIIFSVYLLARPFSKGRAFNPIPITFLANNLPTFKATIEENEYIFELDTGANCTFSITSETLQKIKNKHSCRDKSEWYDIKGNRYLAPEHIIGLIEINKSKINNATIKEENIEFIKATSISNEMQPNLDRLLINGRMGLVVLRLIDDWFIDFPNSCLYAIKDAERFKSIKKLDLGKFVPVPIEDVTPVITIKLETDFGTKTFVIDTGASHTILKTPAGLDTSCFIDMQNFSINGHNFGPLKCYLFDIAGPAAKFDGMLGRDFLMKHAIYIDFKNKQLFIGPTENLRR